MRGSLKQRSPGSWALILDLGYEPHPETGKLRRKQKWQTFRGTRKQAETKLTELVNSLQDGEYVDPSKMTVGQWLTEWIGEREADDAAGHLRPVQRHRRQPPAEGLDRQHPVPEAPGVARRGVLRGHPGRQPAGPSHGAPAGAPQGGERERLITVNPADGPGPTPPRREGAGRGARMNCWTATEAKTFLAAAKADGPQAAALYAVAVDSGARKGELCGLRWEDVDLDAGTIRIVPAADEAGTGADLRTAEERLRRDITLSAETVEFLRRHKRAQAELKMANRTTYRDFGLVFAKEYGDLTNRARHDRATDSGEQPGRAAVRPVHQAPPKVKRITFHGMRHTCATLLLQAGEPVHVVSKRLGHARVEITLDTYAHVLPDMQQQAAATMGGILHR